MWRCDVCPRCGCREHALPASPCTGRARSAPSRRRELTIRYTVKRFGDGTPALITQTARAPRDCAAALMRLLEDEPCEIFAILCLNTKLRVLAYHEVSRGSIDMTVVHPREVFRAAILANAAAITVTLDYVFRPKAFAELQNAQAIVLPYDGLNPQPPTYCYLKPHHLDVQTSYFDHAAAGAL